MAFRQAGLVGANLSCRQIVRSGPESNGHTNLDGRIPDGGREFSMARRMCDSTTGWHNEKKNVNHHMNPMEIS